MHGIFSLVRCIGESREGGGQVLVKIKGNILMKHYEDKFRCSFGILLGDVNALGHCLDISSY